jgi:hypothetical protein
MCLRVDAPSGLDQRPQLPQITIGESVRESPWQRGERALWSSVAEGACGDDNDCANCCSSNMVRVGSATTLVVRTKASVVSPVRVGDGLRVTENTARASIEMTSTHELKQSHPG